MWLHSLNFEKMHKLWVLLFICFITSPPGCYAESEMITGQYDEKFSLRPTSCPYSLTCAKREIESNEPGVGRSSPGVGRSGVGRSGPGVGRSAPGVGRSAPGVGRSAPGVGRSAPGVGRSAPEVGRSAPENGQSLPPGIDRSKPDSPGLDQAGTTNDLNQSNPSNETSSSRVRRALLNTSLIASAPAYAAPERLPCYCDEDCSLYGDCCKDGPFPTPFSPGLGGNNTSGDRNSDAHRNVITTKKKGVGAVTTDNFNCALLHPDEPQFERKSVYMVSRCPGEASPFLARKCHKDVPEARYNYMMDVPVVSSTSGLVYANIYCAHCHKDLPLAKHNHTIVCNCDLNSKQKLRTMPYKQGTRTWIAPLSEQSNCVPGAQVSACALSVHYPENLGRHCEYQLTDQCASDWDNESDRELCKSYNYYVQDSTSNVYKNPICAKCNHVPLSSVRCLAPNLHIRFGSDVGGNVFKLSDLFDTNQDCSADDAVDIIFEECLQIYEQSEQSTTAFDIIYMILMSLSLTAMVLHIAIFLLLFTQRNLHTKNLFSMTCSLFGAELLLLVCSRVCSSTVACYIGTVTVYYLFMSAFLWMNVMSYDVCKTFRSNKIRSNSHRLYIKYSIYAFGVPALMAAIVVTVDLLAPQSVVSPGFGGFWFSNRGGLLLFFIGPTLAIFLANAAMLVVSMYDIYTHQKSTKFGSAAIRKSRSGREAESFLKHAPPPATAKDEPINEASKLNQIQGKIKENLDKIKIDKARLILYSKLALIMGLPWFFALFDNISVVCKYIFNILNGLQGVLIFVAFDCKVKVMAAVCEKFGWQSVAEFLGSTSSNTGSTSGGSGSSTKRRLSNKTSTTVGKLSST